MFVSPFFEKEGKIKGMFIIKNVKLITRTVFALRLPSFLRFFSIEKLFSVKVI